MCRVSTFLSCHIAAVSLSGPQEMCDLAGIELLHLVAEMRRCDRAAQNGPWHLERWQFLVGTTRAPWVCPPANQDHVFGWTETQISYAARYIEDICEIEDVTARKQFMRPADDIYSQRRDLVNETLSKAWRDNWNIPDIILQVLRQCHKDRETVIAAHGGYEASNTVIHISTCQLIYAL